MPVPQEKHTGVLSEMRTQGFRPNNWTFTSLLGACYALEDQLVGSKVHCQVFKFGFVEDVRVQTSLLGMYSHCGNLESAAEVFGGMADRDSIAWNSMIFACMKNDKLGEGPTLFTYSMLLNGCGKLGDHVSGKIIHAQVIVCDLSADVPLENALLDMYCKCGYMETALCLFKYMENSMISGYSDNGDGNMAVSLFIQLCRISYRKPNEYTLAAVISGTGDLPASYYGKPLHAQVQKLGFESSVLVGSTLIYMYFKNEEARSAQRLFSAMPTKDVITWTEMVSGHTRLGDCVNAIKFFNKMQEEGHKLDNFSLSNVLSSCADMTDLRQGEMIHYQVVKAGFEEDMCVCGCLVDMYAKNGDLKAAIFSLQKLSTGVVFNPNTHAGTTRKTYRSFFNSHTGLLFKLSGMPAPSTGVVYILRNTPAVDTGLGPYISTMPVELFEFPSSSLLASTVSSSMNGFFLIFFLPSPCLITRRIVVIRF
ncbi:hypothetical protein MKW92_020843 [Papaver armeniacum]|nr:hypothetical protein MKW92_020843 [Papaver armeniacum]